MDSVSTRRRGVHTPGKPPLDAATGRNAGGAERVPLDVGLGAEASAGGRKEAFALYVLPEVEVLFRVARSLTCRAPDAEDLVQDTLLRAYQGMGGFDGAHPRAWLLTIMRNANINKNRRRRPELLDDQDLALKRLVAIEGRTADVPEEVVVGERFDTVVSSALSALPERYRDVVMLVDMEGLSYAEAAQALGIPEGTVMSRLHRARSRMRQRLVAAGLAPRRTL